MSHNILVIKLGALGDFIQAGGPFATIRAYLNRAFITLLTSKPFAEFSARSPWFDEVWVDHKPKIYQFGMWLNLRTRLRNYNFERVYDLQTSDRTNIYFKLYWPDRAPEWSGIAKGCSYPHSNPNRDFMHTIDRQAEQLVMTGLPSPTKSDFSWVQGDVSRFDLRSPYALIVPGGAAHRRDKRWPVQKFRELSSLLDDKGIQSVVIGTCDEVGLGNDIVNNLRIGLNLAGQTSLEDLFQLARDATYAIGNDTGPMHLISTQDCPTVVLYSDASDPNLCAQRGSNVTILRRDKIASLIVEDVVKALPDAHSA